MLLKPSDLHVRVRNQVFSLAVPGTRFAFDVVEAFDLGNNAAGPLFEQNEEFWIFEPEIDDVRRAGPGVHSPRRCAGSLGITFFSKASYDEVAGLRKLESVSAWFEDTTIQGIRFRSFLPLGSSRAMGFTAYAGVMNCDFEIQPKG